jgi:hypothetical protein
MQPSAVMLTNNLVYPQFKISLLHMLLQRTNMPCPTCNLVETVHNKWLQRSGKNMTCLYEATVDDMIRAFMQIATWLKGGYDGKNIDSTSFKFKTAAKCRDPKMLVDAMKSYPWTEDVNTRDCTLEGS